MRILVISNLYPPCCIGGYEMRCRDVVDGLRAKGHQVRVLTSIYGTDATTVKEAHVERCLPHLWSGFGPLASFWHQLQCELRSAYALKRALHEFKPQLISVWNMYLLSGALLTLVERASRPVVFHLDDDWMLKEDPWSQAWARHSSLLQRVVKSAVRPWVNHRIASVAASIISSQCVFISAFRKHQYEEAGWPVSASPVLHGGVPDAFLGRRFETLGPVQPPRRLLFAGVITPAKSPHLAIEALARLRRAGYADLTLSIIGPDHHDREYVQHLKTLVRTEGLQASVHFQGAAPREAMPAVYHAHDIFLFTSNAPEGFPLTILEAMANGLPVIASLSGGQNEILRNGINSLTYQPNDISMLTDNIKALVDRPLLARELAEAGHNMVKQEFTSTPMVARHEALFQAAIEMARTSSPM